LSKAIVAVISIYVAVNIWNDYFTGLIYLSSPKKMPLQVELRSILINMDMASDILADTDDIVEQQKISDMVRYGVIIIASVPMLVLYPFLQRYLIKGVMIGSVKG
jgi:putative aldouronate transport system permease protein